MTEIKNLDDFFGRNVSYSKSKFKIYERLRADPLSPFKGKNMSDVFVFAAVAGFRHNKKTKLVKAMPQISAVAFSRKQKAILLSLVISDTNGIDILFDAAKATRTVEEYANWGIEEIESELKGNVHGADTITKMSSLMKETINEELSKKV